MPFILGLTGSIGMGKSATAALFRQRGVPVYDADKAVHSLYCGEAVPLIEEAFPGVTEKGIVNRGLLSKHVFDNPQALKQLEALVHPLVYARKDAFLRTVKARGGSLAVLDIPLLFETGGEGMCNAAVVVSADSTLQRTRVLSRAGMTAERFERLLACQMSDTDKRRRAHFIVETGRGFACARRAVDDILRAVSGRFGVAHQ